MLMARCKYVKQATNAERVWPILPSTRNQAGDLPFMENVRTQARGGNILTSGTTEIWAGVKKKEVTFQRIRMKLPIGTLCSKKPKPRSEAAKAEAAELGPVVLELEGNRLTFEDGAWRSGKRRTGVCNSAVGMALLQFRLPWSLSNVYLLFGGKHCKLNSLLGPV
jgi:hypothetical protein